MAGRSEPVNAYDNYLTFSRKSVSTFDRFWINDGLRFTVLISSFRLQRMIRNEFCRDIFFGIKLALVWLKNCAE